MMNEERIPQKQREKGDKKSKTEVLQDIKEEDKKLESFGNYYVFLA